MHHNTPDIYDLVEPGITSPEMLPDAPVCMEQSHDQYALVAFLWQEATLPDPWNRESITVQEIAQALEWPRWEVVRQMHKLLPRVDGRQHSYNLPVVLDALNQVFVFEITPT